MDKETKKVMERTGLSREEAEIYWCFYRHADWSGESGIILPGDVKHDLWELLGKGEMTSEERQNLAQDSYDHWLDVFRDKGLIAEDEVQHNNFSYPVLIGYQPFDDAELYVAYRTKWEERWSGRMSVELMATEGKLMRKKGYEFRGTLIL